MSSTSILAMSSYEPELNDATVVKRSEQPEEKLAEPPRYRVLLYNDDYTPMEFVVSVLEEVFQYSYFDADALMWRVHVSGVGIVGVYPYEIAETKVRKATQMAHEYGFPLLFDLAEETEK
ncbi:MAG: ATP-dependent Clp protease adaptor ClpS [Acidobacteriota bacterium]